MYRLLKARCVAINNKYTATLQNNLQQSTKVCSFCSFYHQKIRKQTVGYVQQRRRTTTINTALLHSPQPKKVRKKQKRYGELLEVANNTSSNQKASIQKLNAEQLSMLVDQPDITLDKLYTIKLQLNDVNCQRIKEYEGNEMFNDLNLLQQVGVIEEPNHKSIKADEDEHSSIMEDLQASGLADQAGIIKNSMFLQTIKEDVNKEDVEEEAKEHMPLTETVKKASKPKRKQNIMAQNALEEASEATRKAKEEKLARELFVYLRACLSRGMTSRAHYTLLHYRNGGIKYANTHKITDVALYNVLLRVYASTANMRRIKELWDIIKEDSIKPSPQTYASVFEAFGRRHEYSEHEEFLNNVHSDMEENGMTFDEILKIPTYILDQQQCVMKTIRSLQPDFQPTESVVDYSYNCHLLNKIDATKPRVNSSPAQGLFTANDMRQRLHDQLSNEIDGMVEIKSIEKVDELTSWVNFCRNIIINLEARWTEIALDAFDRHLQALKHRERLPVSHAMSLYPYLCVLEKEEYIKVIIRNVRQLADGSETFSPSLSHLYVSMGVEINDKYQIDEIRRSGVMETIQQVYFDYCDWYLNPKDATNTRIAWQKLVTEKRNNGMSMDIDDLQWPHHVLYRIGKFLYNIILKDIKIDINCVRRNCTEKHYLPAFYTLFRTEGKFFKEEIKPHPILSRLYRESQPETLTFPTNLVPSICPPKPWYSIHSGGYIIAKCEVIRVPVDAHWQRQRLKSAPPQQLWPLLDSLNQLASIPWSVNEPILDVIIKVFQDGGSTKLNVPQPPSVLPPVPLLQQNSNQADRIKNAKARLELRQRKGEMYSLWCDLLYRLSLANHFRDKTFWLPHNMDFRGRVYPIPPHLSHLGSDLARSLLIFALGKPLGPGGLDWLKIHVINLTGFKKREPVSERLRYANEMMDKILDSAENPLTGQMWWSTSDEPWQTLAACMEVAKALKVPDPEKYVCHFPIHQDGSCNGLQHYAALGRDQIGAENVNLHPFDSPQDVYSCVAAMVEERRERDAEAGVEVAKILKGFVARKVIKQTVMTTVYGVTKFGARLQIARQLKDIDHFPQEQVWPASMYLVQQTFESLRTMFGSAREIQDWLTECARVISITCSRNVEWVTPLGLPIVQPYSKLNKISKSKDFVVTGDRPNTMKQKNAFPPNFIHSLDSSHMMLTSLHCENEGLTFVSVHDCYWTHPCTVEQMNKICREQFVALHSEPILDDLSKFMVEKYCDDYTVPCETESAALRRWKLRVILSKVPNKGSFNLEGVLKSVYFFS